MTYQGHIENGKVVLDAPVALPEGTPVSVAVRPASEQEKSVLTWLADNAVENVACPPDLADHHDHYLYGTLEQEA